MSLPKYQKYRDSGEPWLGSVPAHWDVHRLKNLFKIRKRIVGEEGHQVLSITQRGIKIKDIESNDGQLSMDYSKYQLVTPGDFAMNHMDLLTGFVDISSHAGVTSPDYRVFAIRDGVHCEPKYFLYLLQNGYRQKIFYAFGQGASEFGRWRFATDQFNGFRFPCPPLEEQTAIAAFLDRETAKIDALIAEQENLIVLLVEKRQATISHAVTKGISTGAQMKESGVAWLGEVPAHWDILKGGRLGVLFGSGPVAESDVHESGQIPFIKVGSLSPTGFEIKNWTWYVSGTVASQCAPYRDFIVFPKRGAAIFMNKVNIVDCEALIDPNLMGWKIGERAITKFVAYILKARGLSELADVSTVPQINNKHIEPEMFPVPPLTEQAEIIDFLGQECSKLDLLQSESKRAIALLKERRSALITAAVTGRIDVRGMVLQASVESPEAIAA
jgi:type I restriction enzyme S subunit